MVIWRRRLLFLGWGCADSGHIHPHTKDDIYGHSVDCLSGRDVDNSSHYHLGYGAQMPRVMSIMLENLAKILLEQKLNSKN